MLLSVSGLVWSSLAYDSSNIVLTISIAAGDTKLPPIELFLTFGNSVGSCE
jgi:hypothetical protein